MLLVFCFLINITYAWLLHEIPKASIGSTSLGQMSVGDGVLKKERVQEFTLPNSGSMNIGSYTTITNMGYVDALVRVYYNIEIGETLNTDETTYTKQIATTEDFSSVEINSDFVASNENIENVYSGYYFYNKVLEPNTSVNFIKSYVTPTSTVAGKTVKLNFFYELVNFEGGPYQLKQQLPWKNFPESWFLNYSTLTKPKGSVITPKFEIGFGDVSKIEMTAKTTEKKNIFFSRYNNTWIGVGGNSGEGLMAQQLVGFAYPSKYSDASAFLDGEFHTISFTWSNCSASTDDFITLVWDTVWSQEIEYKQIRIWNKSGELVYDCVPSPSGKFLNKVSGTEMTMYTQASGVLTETNSTYTYSADVLYENNFENDVLISGLDGATSTVSTDDKNTGTKSLKIVNAYDYGNLSMKGDEARISSSISFKKGYKYTVSLWVKTTAPEGAKAYSYAGSKYQATLPGLEVNYADGLIQKTNVYKANTWTLVTVTTPIITEDYNGSFSYVIPGGASYVTYIDDVVVCKG